MMSHSSITILLLMIISIDNYASEIEQPNNHVKITFYDPHQQHSLPENKKIILVGGCFDILHLGHISFLEKAKQLGDYLIIALEPDERIIHHKNRMPTHTQKERAYNLASLRFVDEIILLPLLTEFKDYNTLVHIVQPTIIATTKGDPQLHNKEKQAQEVGADCIVVTERIGAFSSTRIYQELSNL